MHPLNPFLRAFFRSTVPGQCIPVENHVSQAPAPLRIDRSGRSMLMCVRLGSTRSHDGMPYRLTRPGVQLVLLGPRRVGGVSREPCAAHPDQPRINKWEGGIQCTR
jgi:hypothetical protein